MEMSRTDLTGNVERGRQFVEEQDVLEFRVYPSPRGDLRGEEKVKGNHLTWS